MVAVQVAARLLELHGVQVAFILLDSSPASRYDVLDQSWFDGVVFLYESGFRFPTVLRGGYELGERVLNKHERSWGQILDQTMEQLSPIAPSSVLIQTESAYIYHFDLNRFVGKLGDREDGVHRQPQGPDRELRDGPGHLDAAVQGEHGLGFAADRRRTAGARQPAVESRSSTGRSSRNSRTSSCRCPPAAGKKTAV